MSVDGSARATTRAASRDFPPDSDDQPLRVAMKKVATALKGANVPFALSGGYASWARGGPEPVHDVDFVLLADDVPHALRVLDAAGLQVVEPPEDWLVKVYDGRPSGRMANVELTLPGSVLVNARGRRFVNEATNYHDLNKAFRTIDPATATTCAS